MFGFFINLIILQSDYFERILNVCCFYVNDKYLNCKFTKCLIYCLKLQVTWADVALAVSLENFERIFGKDSLEPYPNLRGLKDRVYALPRIKEWIARRPQTEF